MCVVECRTTDAFIVGYADQTIPCFALDDKAIIDTIPGDMVINAMLVAIATQYHKKSQVIYHISAATENPLEGNTIVEWTYRYFSIYPHTTHRGTNQKRRVLMFNKYRHFLAYTFFVYRLPMEVYMHTPSTVSFI
ncbi:hypothetical protein PR202_gb07475 [Eleusine coracana subsp. coracana]|uniref:Fatty acyl-CoA reductase n=1 Tax=Eleusine coracana subsp. coracana TaxID=191504 RepID=A0AAV5ECA9_ELECO|nr:hypothetical protein PR202_gb07475 [Eleusine coracana subsp. coracana]